MDLEHLILHPKLHKDNSQYSMLLVVKDLLLDHVGLPHVLDLAVHLVHLSAWRGLGGHPETFSLLGLSPKSTPSWLKVLDLDLGLL